MGGTSPETKDCGARSEHRGTAFRRWFWPHFGEIACLFVVFVLLGLPIAEAGVWEAGELEHVEFARRIADGLFSGAGADLPAAPPSLRELRRGELPFLGIALGFASFGPHHLVARVLCLGFSLLALCALHLLVRRVEGRRAACLSSVMLATIPLFYWQARTALLDAVTMASLAWATAGLFFALEETDRPRGERRPSSVVRSLAFLSLGAVAAVLGSLCRGLWLGAVVPLLSVGLVAQTSRTGEAWRRRLGQALLGLGVLGFVLGLLVLFGREHPPEGTVSRLMGGVMVPAARVRSFDSGLPELLFGTFPYAGLLVVACLQPFFVKARAGEGSVTRRRTLRLLCLLVVGICYVLTELGSLTLAPPVFPAVFALAGLAALAIVEFERAPRFPFALLVVALAVIVLVHADFENEPNRLLRSTGLAQLVLPSEVVAEQLALSRMMTGSVLLGGLLLACGLWLPARETEPTPRERLRAYVRGFVAGRHGSYFAVTLVLETALVTLAVLAGLRLLGWDVPALRSLGRGQLRGLTGLFLVPPALLLVFPLMVWGGWVSTRVGAWLSRRGFVVRSPWSLGMLVAGLLGLVVAQPRLLAALAPMPPLEELHALRRAGEPVGVLGVDPRELGADLAREVVRFDDPTRAVDFLLEEPGPRYMFVAKSALGDLNAAYREHTATGQNLPIADRGAGKIRLAASALPPGQPSHNPLSEWVVERPLEPNRRVEAVLGGVVRVVGWELRDAQKRPVSTLERSASPELCVTYAVTRILIGEWEIFVHIDGQGRRINADHPPLQGAYPMRLWQPNDTVVDCVRLTVDQSYEPGTYQLYFGFYRGSRRLEVTSGEHDENRVRGGALVVR